ncbi:hypothetical protein Taro_017070 [Colocasia esculenta]|uniref:Uncharacterized protein n=1 Tax=Colocasia esculenta TaxID=4460 RepID=A0A843UFD5_COLES|nr:hypothetical protein [Colocasia esculenta]
MYIGVDDGVFVPPSDVYIAIATFVLPMGCLCLHGVTCLYDLDMRLDVCRFMTPEDVDMANGSLVTTCGVSVWANAGGLDHEEEAPTGVEDPSRHVRPM